MTRITTMLSAFAVALAFALPSWAQTKELPKQTITVAGTVETIDKNKRLLQIKTADGKFVAVDVPAGAKRFDELKVGDKVKATYNNNVIVRVKAAGEAAIDSAGTASTMGKEAKPGGAASMMRTMTATISDIDKANSSMTFVGPNEWKYSRRIVDPRCSIRSRWATGSTSPGARNSPRGGVARGRARGCGRETTIPKGDDVHRVIAIAATCL